MAIPTSPSRAISPKHSRQNSRQKGSSSHDARPKGSASNDSIPKSPPVDAASPTSSPVGSGSGKKQPLLSSSPVPLVPLPSSLPPLNVAGGGPVSPPLPTTSTSMTTNEVTKVDEVRDSQESQPKVVFKPALSGIPDNDDGTPKSSPRILSIASSAVPTPGNNSPPLPEASPLLVVPRPTRTKKDRQLIASGKGKTADSNGPHYHVLVVDDSAMSRKVARYILLTYIVTHPRNLYPLDLCHLTPS